MKEVSLFVKLHCLPTVLCKLNYPVTFTGFSGACGACCWCVSTFIYVRALRCSTWPSEKGRLFI